MAETFQALSDCLTGEKCPACDATIQDARIEYRDWPAQPFSWRITWTCRVPHSLGLGQLWYRTSFDLILARLAEHCSRSNRTSGPALL